MTLLVFDIPLRQSSQRGEFSRTQPSQKQEQHTMDYGAKSMAANNTSNVDINMEMDEVLKRIQSSRNVAGVMVINNEGIPLKSTLDSSTTVQYGGMISDLAAHAR